MIGHIYYAIGSFIIISILTILLKFKKIYSISEWVEKFKKVTRNNPEKKDFRDKDEYELYTGVIILSSIEFIWSLLGLLTNSWYIFLFLIILMTLSKSLLSLIKYTIIDKIISFSLILFKFLIYLYLIINHFHLHIDTINIIKSYII